MLFNIWIQCTLHCLYWCFRYRALTSCMTSRGSNSVYGKLVELVTGPGCVRRIDFEGKRVVAWGTEGDGTRDFPKGSEDAPG